MTTAAPSHAGLAEVRGRIAVAAEGAKRDPASVRLIAVSKTFSAAEILPVIHAGQRCFGENRVQEAQSKWPALKQQFSDIELHLIGPLQSNKARDAVALFDAIHSIDRSKIAEAVANEMMRQKRQPLLFVQVNTGDEPQKAGISPTATREFMAYCRETLKLRIEGLMCIPPIEEEPAIHFALLAKLAAETGVTSLSMGMSADYETAIAFGATDIRVGSAIFGARD